MATDPFLGQLIETAIASRDHRRTIDRLLALGIGPWDVFHLSPENVADQTWHGEPAEFRMIAAFATVGPMIYEVMEPVSGPSVLDDMLATQDEAFHHVAFDCNGIAWEDRLAGFAERGFAFVQGGLFAGGNRFGFFAPPDGGAIIETLWFAPGFELPEAHARIG